MIYCLSFAIRLLSGGSPAMTARESAIRASRAFCVLWLVIALFGVTSLTEGTSIMLRHSTILLAVLGILVVSGLWLDRAASRADDKDAKQQEKSAKKESDKEKPKGRIALKAFMRKKLEASQSVLEGLAVEDFDLIERGARQLRATSVAAEFMVINDPLYAESAADFTKIVDKLVKAAKEKRLDGSTLAYLDMTMSCVECHKYVRNVLVAK